MRPRHASASGDLLSAPEHRPTFGRWSDPERRREGHAFISYARDDLANMLPFVELMREWGYTIWLDDNLTAGSKWSEEL